MTAESEDSQPASVDGPSILCTNDDGIHAGGLNTLIEVASRLGRVQVVAPDREQSATSHSLTVHRPLRATRTPEGHHVIDGTPTDCVLIGINQLSGHSHPTSCCPESTTVRTWERTFSTPERWQPPWRARSSEFPAIAISYSNRAAERIPGYADVLYEPARFTDPPRLTSPRRRSST